MAYQDHWGVETKNRMANATVALETDIHARYILLRPTELVTADFLVRALGYCYDLPEFRERRDLWDMRDIDLQMDYEGMRKVSTFTRKNRGDDWAQDRTAIVVSAELAYGFARMYESLTDGLGYQVRIFQSVDEARRWLEE